MVPPHGLLIQSQVSYWLDDSGMKIGGAAGSRTLTIPLKRRLYCLLILRPQNGTRGEIRTPNLLALDQLPLLVGLRERKLVAATGLAPARSGLKDRSLDLLCIRGQNRLSGSYSWASTLPAVTSRRPDREVRTTSGQEWIQSDHQVVRPAGLAPALRTHLVLTGYKPGVLL